MTERARDISRTPATRELADTLIEAAQEEEAAFRQLRDRWQPGSLALFEVVEQHRVDSARAQRDVEDRAAELQEELGKASDPEYVQAVEEFSAAFDVVKDDWSEFHDDVAGFRSEVDSLDTDTFLARFDELIERFTAIVEAVYGLPSADATESMAEALQEAAEVELASLSDVNDALTAGYPSGPAAPSDDDTPTAPTSGGETGDPPGPTARMDAAIDESEDVLAEVSRMTKSLLSGDFADRLTDVRSFNEEYEGLLVEWDAFHRRYNDWRETEGGCDRTEVLQALGRFTLRAAEIGRRVRDLPQSSYLLPMYTLLVEASEREEEAVRTLSSSWRPFAVDVFKAADQERATVNRLRRQASIGLQGLLDRP